MYNNSFDPKEGSTENESAEAVAEESNEAAMETHEEEPEEEAAVEE